MRPLFVTEPKSPFQVLREEYLAQLENSSLDPAQVQIAMDAFDASVPHYSESFGYQVSGPWGVDSESTAVDALVNVKTYNTQYPSVNPERQARAYVVPFYIYGDTTIETENIEIIDAEEIQTLVKKMSTCLGSSVVATALGVENPRTITARLRTAELTITATQLEKLRYLVATWIILSQVEGDEVARTWLTSSHPLFEEQPPVVAVRENQHRRVFYTAAEFAKV